MELPSKLKDLQNLSAKNGIKFQGKKATELQALLVDNKICLDPKSSEKDENFAAMTCVELRRLCEERGLTKAGVKSALIERLVANKLKNKKIASVNPLSSSGPSGASSENAEKKRKLVENDAPESKKLNNNAELLTASPELCAFLGIRKEARMTRPEVARQVWQYVQNNKLLPKEDDEVLKPDTKMAKLFGSTDIFTSGGFFLAEMMKKHLK